MPISTDRQEKNEKQLISSYVEKGVNYEKQNENWNICCLNS